MLDSALENSGPLVSVMIPTFNRRRYLPIALGSALAQGYRNIEVFVVNDGGEDVSDVIASFGDHRIRFINRKENRGKAFSLNQALSEAKGKYVAYLDDDDIWYPHHVGTLVAALENGPETVAYSDLYKTYCRQKDDGTRVVVAKKVEVSRDFDRFLMLHMNHILHVSLMHRRDLLEKTGLYNETLNVMIDWDMTRRLAFFGDFRHLRDITGEFYAPIGECDRISVQRRRDKADYLRNILTIRTTHPARPWDKLKELCIILAPSDTDGSTAQMLRNIWMWTFYPYTVYLPWTAREFASLSTDMPNIRRITVGEGSTFMERVDAAAAACDGEYVVVAPSGLEIDIMWVEKSLWPLMNTYDPRLAFELERSCDSAWSAVMKLEHLRMARSGRAAMDLRESLKAAGISIRKPGADEMPFGFDDAYNEGKKAEASGDWLDAAQLYQYAAGSYGNRLWMDGRTAEAMRKAGRFGAAIEFASRVNGQRPTVASLRTEALARKASGDTASAIGLLEKARDILEGKHTIWT